jgi:ferredoxin
MKRNVIQIDEEKCTGCGLCIPNCPEGAIQIIGGKARLVSDLFCDGLGACIGHCPEGAIMIEEREAEPYDERRVMENVIKGGAEVIEAHLKHLRGHGQQEYLAQAMDFLAEKGIAAPETGTMRREVIHGETCPGSRMADFRRPVSCPGSRTVDSRGEAAAPEPPEYPAAASELRQWPVQLQLVNANAPYFQDADLLIAADCVPFAHAGFHKRFLRKKALIIFCPKLDRMPEAYVEKLSEIIRNNTIKSLTLVHMEVPCCFGLRKLVEEAVRRSGKTIQIADHTISIRGALL